MSNNDATNAEQATPRRSERERHPSERMKVYIEEESAKREGKLQSFYLRWKSQIRECRTLLKGKCNEEDLAKSLDNVQSSQSMVNRAFEDLRHMCTPAPSTVRKVDACNAITDEILRISHEKLAGLDDTEKDPMKLLKQNQYANSVFSWTNTETSRHSKVQELMAEAAADLAAKKVKLAAVEQEETYRQQLEHLQAERNKFKIQSEIDEAKARLDVFADFAQEENTTPKLPACEVKTEPSPSHVGLQEPPCILKLLDRISSWNTAISIVARLKRLSNGVKGTQPPTVEERLGAEKIIIAEVQRASFGDSIKLIRSGSLPKTNALFQLDPIFQDNIIKVGGRLRKANLCPLIKHPIILPKHSHVTTIILAHAHAEVKHQGRGMTLNKLRALGFWIVGGSKVVAKFIRQCVTCRKLRRPPETQKMADLPSDRVEETPPFTYCGMDCFGPFITKQGRKQMKRYGLLFTCMCTRAIHIEMLDDLSTDAFINGLRCFIAIRGAVRQIRSDQGTNFIGARNELKRASERIVSFLTEKQCDFMFNAPDASHTGGVWERQIRTVRNILDSILPMCADRLDDSSLRTVFYEVMSIVNCRPLTVSEIDNPESLEPLTPNHILTCKSAVPHPPPGTFVKEDIYLRKRWRRVQYLLEQFWNRWRKEYLMQISQRQKWHKARRNLSVGDVVLVKDINLPRNQWPLGRITDAKPDDDGLVRRVKVKLGRGDGGSNVLERNVNKIVLLVENNL